MTGLNGAQFMLSQSILACSQFCGAPAGWLGIDPGPVVLFPSPTPQGQAIINSFLGHISKETKARVNHGDFFIISQTHSLSSSCANDMPIPKYTRFPQESLSSD